MLQEFLDSGLLEIGDDADKFGNLQKAADDLGKKIASTRALLIPFTLVGLDSEVSPSEPVFAEVEAAVKTHWPTLRNKHTDTPRQIFRAVIWEALSLAGAGDPTSAAIIWLVGGASLPYLPIEPKAAKICEPYLRDLGVRTETPAAEEWSLESNIKAGKLPKWKPASDESPINVDADALKQHFSAAMAHMTWNILQSQPNTAHTTFTTNAVNAVLGAVNPVATSVVSQIKTLKEAVNSHISAADEVLQMAIKTSRSRPGGLERRNELLWWKETLYSPAGNCSYRALDISVAATLLAIDLHAMVTPFTPCSVEYLLRETVRKLRVPDEAKLRLADFVDAAVDKGAGLLPQGLPVVAGSSRRVCLAEFLGAAVGGTVNSIDMKQRLGACPDTLISPEEIAVWVYRDLQALRLAKGK